MKILITSGGTKVPIDDVRFIGNMSSGKYGAEIAEEFHLKLYDTVYLYAKHGKAPKIVNWSDSPRCTQVEFNDYFDYLELSQNFARQSDIIISAAAVSDYIVDKTAGKISSGEEELVIRLRKAQKVLPLLRIAAPNSLIVGFKLLVSPTDEDKHRAIQKVFDNGADLVVYNDLTEIRKGNTMRYLYDKDMNFLEAPNAKHLVQLITNEYSTRSNR